MENMTEILEVLKSMSVPGIIALIILAAFGLAGYTVWAAVKLGGGHRGRE